ncbi:MAG TPA: hypothetical protein VKA06_08685, partial [Spirochaetia bacterium]|nr:hypothetical protein [Spirochaetia bacterium]
CYPADLGIAEWVRTSTLNRGGAGPEASVQIHDAGRLDREGVPIQWVLMLPAAPTIVDESTVVLAGANGAEARLRLSAENLERGQPVVERIPLDDRKMSPYWGDEIYRLLVPATTSAARFEFSLEFATSTISRG